LKARMFWIDFESTISASRLLLNVPRKLHERFAKRRVLSRIHNCFGS
jgi:hypothetical protein